MTITLRAGRPADIAVLELWSVAGAEPGHTDNAAGLDTLLAHDPDALIVAEDDGRIVGSVIAGWDGWRGSVYRLAVAPSHRRRGVATRLLRQAEARLSRGGAVRLQAVVVESAPLATGFWDRSGWDRQSQRLRFVSG